MGMFIDVLQNSLKRLSNVAVLAEKCGTVLEPIAPLCLHATPRSAMHRLRSSVAATLVGFALLYRSA